jgi:hypothetical protein
MCGRKKEEVVVSWKQLHSEEIRNFYASPTIIRVFKPRYMRRVGHVARMGEMVNAYNISVRKPKGKRQLGRHRHGCNGSGQGPVAGSCEHGNEPSGSMKGGEFLD